MDFTNAKIKEFNGQVGTAGLMLTDLKKVYGEKLFYPRLNPGEVIRVPVEFTKNRPNMEITHDPATRPCGFATDMHADAWLFPGALKRQGLSTDMINNLRDEVRFAMIALGEKELAAKNPSGVVELNKIDEDDEEEEVEVIKAPEEIRAPAPPAPSGRSGRRR